MGGEGWEEKGEERVREEVGGEGGRRGWEERGRRVNKCDT